MLIDFVSCLCAILYVIRFIFKKNNGALFILLAYLLISGLVSSFFVESGIYVSEIGRESYHLGATRFYSVIVVSIFFLISIFEKLMSRYIKVIPFKVTPSYFLCSASLFIAFCILVILFSNLLISGIPIINNNITRFNFWENYSRIPNIELFLGKLSMPVLLLGAVLISIKMELGNSYRKEQLLIFLFFLYLLLLGHKFSGFISALSLLYGVIIVKRVYLGRKMVSITDIMSMFFLIIFLFIVSFFFFSQSSGGVIDIVEGNAFLAVLYRIFVLQGYAWFAFFERYIEDGVIPNLACSNMDYALLMITKNPKFFMHNGIDIANIYPGVLLLSGGVINIIIYTVVFSFALSFLGLFAYKAILARSIFRSTISLQLMFWTTGAIAKADFMHFFQYKYLVLLFSLLFLSLLSILSRNISNSS